MKTNGLARLLLLVRRPNNGCARQHQQRWNPSDDAEFQAAHQQGIDDTFLYPGSINLLPAWDLETGKPFIKVGVIDAAIAGYHEDFGGTPSAFMQSKVKGWDFQSNMEIEQFQSTQAFSSNSHQGTWMAGIIGAIRNNSVGIAGVAGGDWNDSSNAGVTLYSIRAIDDGAN